MLPDAGLDSGTPNGSLYWWMSGKSLNPWICEQVEMLLNE
jgi:hypothetical protein